MQHFLASDFPLILNDIKNFFYMQFGHFYSLSKASEFFVFMWPPSKCFSGTRQEKGKTGCFLQLLQLLASLARRMQLLPCPHCEGERLGP